MSSPGTPHAGANRGAGPASIGPSAARLLSGITPSGSLTLGNYLGALRRFAAGSAHDGAYFFVADLHAMTVPHDPEMLRQLTRQTAALFFAAGVDAERATVFVQSQVPAHVQLAYLLECTAHVGELTRMIQFKERGGRPGTRASLFTYPCLMAADILLYDADQVPVGGDQDQHVELCRDLAIRFNRTYGDTFVVPQLARAARGARVVDLQEPTAKMSKSAPADAAGVIRMLDEPAVIRRKINRAVTDSESDLRYDPDRQPGVSNLLQIVAALTETEPGHTAQDFASYGHLKRVCADLVIEELAPIRRRYARLAADPTELLSRLEDGAIQARRQAASVLSRANAAIGLV